MKFPTISVPFALGQTVATPHVLKVVPKAEIFAALQRHQNCDWGDVCPQDKWANDRAVKGGERPELIAGTQLTGVKLELQKQDTVVFYILRDYRIVAHQDQAA